MKEIFAARKQIVGDYGGKCEQNIDAIIRQFYSYLVSFNRFWQKNTNWYACRSEAEQLTDGSVHMIITASVNAMN